MKSQAVTLSEPNSRFIETKVYEKKWLKRKLETKGKSNTSERKKKIKNNGKAKELSAVRYFICVTTTAVGNGLVFHSEWVRTGERKVIVVKFGKKTIVPPLKHDLRTLIRVLCTRAQASTLSFTCVPVPIALSVALCICVCQPACGSNKRARKKYQILSACVFVFVWPCVSVYIHSVDSVCIPWIIQYAQKGISHLTHPKFSLCVYVCVLAFVQFCTHERGDYTNDAIAAITTQLNSTHIVQQESNQKNTTTTTKINKPTRIASAEFFRSFSQSFCCAKLIFNRQVS